MKWNFYRAYICLVSSKAILLTKIIAINMNDTTENTKRGENQHTHTPNQREWKIEQRKMAIKINQSTCSRAILRRISIWARHFCVLILRFFFCYQAEERLYTVFMYVSYTRHTTQSKMREMAKNNAPKIIFLFHENTISRGALRNVETSIAHNTRQHAVKRMLRKLKNKANAKTEKTRTKQN